MFSVSLFSVYTANKSEQRTLRDRNNIFLNVQACAVTPTRLSLPSPPRPPLTESVLPMDTPELPMARQPPRQDQLALVLSQLPTAPS